jgi:D-alanine-D-alanine ligase
MNKKNVVVLMGGKTPEHEISLMSGREVSRNLPKKYNALPVTISKTGKKWSLVKKDLLLKKQKILDLKGTSKDLVLRDSKEVGGVEGIGKADVVFIAMHGPFGEDGTIQGLLELSDIPYTGPGVLASALGMDKLRFRKVLKAEGIPVPEYIVIKIGEKVKKSYAILGKYPYFIKPNNQGSSVGCSIARNYNELTAGVKYAHKYSRIVLVDKYIKGTEVTCGVIGNDKLIALPLVEIIPLKGEYFDYESKYMESGAKEIVPARVMKNMTKNIQKLAIQTYKAIGCKGFSRVDFIIEDNKHPIVLEINTIPGLTPMSLLPKAAKAYGLSYSQLIDKIIKYGLQKS